MGTLGSCGKASGCIAPPAWVAASGFGRAPPSSAWNRNSLSSLIRLTSSCICVSWNVSPSIWPLSRRFCSSSCWMRTISWAVSAACATSTRSGAASLITRLLSDGGVENMAAWTNVGVATPSARTVASATRVRTLVELSLFKILSLSSFSDAQNHEPLQACK